MSDLIERQAAIDAMCDASIPIVYKGKPSFVVDYLGVIASLPSVSTEKTGRWIDEGFYADGHSERAYRCSECDEHYIGYVGEFKHCPNCGARMEGE